MKRIPFFAIAVVLVWATLVPARAEIIEQILVKVNGEIFTKTDLENRQVTVLRQMGQQADLKSNPSDTQLRQMLEQITPDLIVNVVVSIPYIAWQRGRSARAVPAG